MKSAKSEDQGLTILLTQFKTKVLNLSLNLGLSAFVKSAQENIIIIEVHHLVFGKLVISLVTLKLLELSSL